MYINIIKYIKECENNKKNFTVTVDEIGNLYNPTNGFVVSITPLINIGMSMLDIIKYIISNKNIKIDNKDYTLYLDGWFENNNDKLTFDICVVIENEKEAIQIGKHCRQIAIYDITKNTTILL